MQTYVFLYNFTDQGIKEIKNSPENVKNATEAWEAMGGKVHGVYCLQGPYDFMSIGEAPNDEVAATFALALGAKGSVRTLSMRAFTAEEFTKIVNNLP